MEALVGPTFSVDAPNAATAVSARGELFFDGGEEKKCEEEEEEEEQEDSLSYGRRGSSSSSSIGAPNTDDDDDDSEEEDDAVSSNASGGALASLDSLQDSLPFRRGLSNYFSGKSKSFGNLSEVSSVVKSVKDVEKAEKPFNQKRRILLANKRAATSNKSSFYTWHNPKSMPFLTPHDTRITKKNNY